MGVLFTCRETVAALSDYLEGTLPLGPFLKTRAHLFSCPGCRTVLATLRVLPALAEGALREADPGPRARQALEGALARLDRVPPEARRALADHPDLPMRLLASAHEHLVRGRTPPVPPWPLPREILDLLPPAEHWRWQEGADGLRRAELCADPRTGSRLLLVYAPPGSAPAPHRHLGSESVLVLEGAMADQGRHCARGDWIHHGEGSCHAPRAFISGCWCMVREQGKVLLVGPAA